jgi:hypothetical protein
VPGTSQFSIDISTPTNLATISPGPNMPLAGVGFGGCTVGPAR